MSGDGRVLAYRRDGNASSGLYWFDREGVRLGSVGPAGTYAGLRLSPDGTRAALNLSDERTGSRDIWILDLDREISMRFTFHPATDWRPVWSHDGSNKIFRKSATSTSDAELVFAMSGEIAPSDTSPDGKWLYGVALRADGSDTTSNIVRWRFERDGAAQTLVETEFRASGPRVSPDGKLLAYHSNESGRFEIYVRSIDEAGVQRRVSSSGGLFPQWRGDGRELFYLSLNNILMSVRLDGGERIASAVSLFPDMPPRRF